jgi:hypothetical protein
VFSALNHFYTNSSYSGDNYFGHGNRDCLCLTCELNHRSGFSRVADENAPEVINNIEDATAIYPGPASTSGRKQGRSESDDGVEDDLQPGMTVTVTNDDTTGVSTEDIETIDASEEESDTDEDMPLGVGRADRHSQDATRRSGRIRSKQPAVERDGSMSTFLQSQDANKRYPRRTGSSSAIPQRMGDSASVSSSTRPSPTPSSSGMTSTRPASRSSRRAAVRGRERTSHMIHNPFGGVVVTKNGKQVIVPSDGMEHAMDPSHVHDDDEDAPGTIRCTVCLSVMEPVWISDRYIEQCPR